jgi:Spy/CpxP family protein refolding chaperone
MIRRVSQRVCRRLFAVSALVLAFAFVVLASRAVAQGHPGGGPPGGGGGQGGQQPGGQPGAGGGQPNPFGGTTNGFPSGGNLGNTPPPQNTSGAPASTTRGGLQLGPPGRWWDDGSFAKSIGLDKNQQHRMDDIFKANKTELVKLYKGLQHEESQLEKITRARDLDEALIDQQIDKVEQARGELEKANAHMLLAIRKEMTPEQTARLDEHRPPPNSSEN